MTFDSITNDMEKYYLDFVNNFVTIEGFADHYGISLDLAKTIIDAGRKVSIEISRVR